MTLRRKDEPAPTPDGNAAEPLETVSGEVERIVFRNEETGYSVCAIREKEGREELIVVGKCADVWVGETLKAEGRWIRHKLHGRQFQAERITCVMPADVKGIERFLASGLIKGIGKVNARRLVQAFRTDTLRVIEKESKRLMQVPGIGAQRREMIKASWNEHKAVRDIVIFLQSHDVGTAQALRIYRTYGNEAIAIVSRNPFRLCRDVWGIGFKSADKIAQSLGIPPESEIRARAGVIYVLETMTEEGHCYCPRDLLVAESEKLLEIPAALLEKALAAELAEKTLVDSGGDIYLAAMYRAETGVAARLRKLLSTPTNFRPIHLDRAIPWAEQRMKIAFDPMQAEALRMALSRKISIITGGPGVGKTTIVRALVDIFAARDLQVFLAAPTGRAAKRMEEATHMEAKTIHRLLKYVPHPGDFEHNAKNPLQGDVFILDEVSMIDISLMHTFLQALPDESCLVLVGDADQLPSVGPGNVLRDLIESGAIPATKLGRIFRQKAQSWIVQNAHLVNKGLSLELPAKGEASDFYFIKAEEPDDVIQKALDLLTQRIPARFQFDPKTDIQVLTPMRRNQLGSENLNTVLQEKLNPAGATIERFGRKYRVGDRVMQIRNNYDKGVFNGDIGVIRALREQEQQVIVAFDDRIVTYEPAELDELDLAYACSIHKSQGSEYPAVVILISTQHYRLLQRNLLYTAITRGRRLVCLVGSYKAVYIAIHNNHILLRRTGLKQRMAHAAGSAPFAFTPPAGG